MEAYYCILFISFSSNKNDINEAWSKGNTQFALFYFAGMLSWIDGVCLNCMDLSFFFYFPYDQQNGVGRQYIFIMSDEASFLKF